MAMNTEDSLREYLRLFVKLPARRPHRPAGPHVRLRRRRRAGRQGDPRRRQALLRGPRAPLRPRRRRRRGQRAHRRPDRRPAGDPRAGQGRHGPRPDGVDDRHPRGPGDHRARRRHDAGGDAGHRDDRPRRSPRPRRRRRGVGDRGQPRAAGAVRPSPDGGRRPPRRRRAAPRRRRRPRGAPGRSPRRRSPRPAGAPATATSSGCAPASRAACPCCTCPSCSPRPPVGGWPRSSPRPSPKSSMWHDERGEAPCPLDALLASKEMVLVLGSGGVGKTTIAAALALAAAVEQGGRVLVLTVDPAKRLADALGVGALGNVATRVPDSAFEDAGVTPRGELWAAMLDTKAGWDDLIRRHAPDAKVRDAVLGNPLYQNITSRFVHSHDYLAMEQLHDLHASGQYDLVVVDTPPSRNALSVLDAPVADARVLRQPAAALAHRAVPLAALHGRVEALLPGGRSSARQRLPARHRRFLRAVPGDGEGLRGAGQRGRGAARRRPHHVPRRVDARDGAGPRSRVPRS